MIMAYHHHRSTATRLLVPKITMQELSRWNTSGFLVKMMLLLVYNILHFNWGPEGSIVRLMLYANIDQVWAAAIFGFTTEKRLPIYII